MVWNKVKLPRFTLPKMTWRRPSRETVNKIILGGLLAAALVGTYYWGRRGGLADGRSHVLDFMTGTPKFMPTSQSADTSGEIVAYLYDGAMAITRRELGDYLIDRFGSERIDFLVNRKIIEMACQAQHITISDAEIKVQLDADLLGFGGLTVDQFVNNVLKKYNKTLFEYKEDVIRPKLALERYVRGKIVVSEEDIQKGFEAKFGPKVDCRIIVLAREQKKDAVDIWTKIRQDPNLFDDYAKKQFMPKIASTGGKVDPVHKHFGNASIEEEAFKLKPGEISSLIEMPDDGSTIILRCEKHIPADATKQINEERAALYQEILQARMGDQMKKIFEELRKKAAPQIFLRHEQRQAPASAQLNATVPAVPAAQQHPASGGLSSIADGMGMQPAGH
jgi:hypothetical protein